MPKKIHRSNERLKKTNRKKTNHKKTNRKNLKNTKRKRLRKKLGGALHYVDRLKDHGENMYTIEQMKNSNTELTWLKINVSISDLTKPLLGELVEYLNKLITKYQEWELSHHHAGGAYRPADARSPSTTVRNNYRHYVDRLKDHSKKMYTIKEMNESINNNKRLKVMAERLKFSELTNKLLNELDKYLNDLITKYQKYEAPQRERHKSPTDLMKASLSALEEEKNYIFNLYARTGPHNKAIPQYDMNMLLDDAGFEFENKKEKNEYLKNIMEIYGSDSKFSWCEKGQMCRGVGIDKFRELYDRLELNYDNIRTKWGYTK
jgi:hypothetical protein